MKVSLAKQTLNAAIVDAMKFLRDGYVSDFENCNTTVHFLRTIVRIFNIFGVKQNMNIIKDLLLSPILPDSPTYF